MPAETTRLNSFLEFVEDGLSNVFDGALKTHPVLWKDWLRQVTAKEWIEDAIVHSGFGPMPEKGVGNPFTVDRPYKGTEKEYTLKTYGLAFVIEHEMLKWDRYGVFGGVTKKLARSGIDKKNQLGYAILNNGFSTSDAVYTTYASEALFSSSHTLLRGGTGKNAPSSAIGLTYLGIQEALTDFALTENEDGLYAMVDPKKVICHPAQRWKLDTILSTPHRHDTANREKNTLAGELSPHSAPYLTSQTAWFIMADKGDVEMAFSIGEDLMFRRDYQVSTWNSTWTMYMSCRIDLLTWPGTWGSQGV